MFSLAAPRVTSHNALKQANDKATATVNNLVGDMVPKVS